MASKELDSAGAIFVATNILSGGWIENGQLVARPTGQPEIKLYPESETKFFALFPLEVEFERDAQGKVSSLNILQGGRVTKATKQ